jgi:gamma-glutamyltranspeptidase/glutathione hydrolase
MARGSLAKRLLVLLALAACPAPPGPAGAASLPPTEATHGMVVSAQRLASAVGLDILRQGGSAIDAAVAVGYALAVVHPCCGNIGGGGFMLIHLAGGRDVVIDFRETAPLAATRDMYLDAAGKPVPDASTRGYEAVGVPGTVAGLDDALLHYGSLPRARVMAPAIELAARGFVLSDADVAILKQGRKAFAEEANAAAIFLKGTGAKDRAPFAAGDRLVQPQLARTLRLIAASGPAAFYRGPIAEAMVAASRAHGGLLSPADLAGYAAIEREPLRCRYRGYNITAVPPPSSGGTTICEILNIIEGYDLAGLGFDAAASLHVMVEAMRHAFLDRNSRLGDPAFVANPLAHLLDKAYAARLRAAIEPDRATPSSKLQPGQPPHEGGDTTHYAVVDAAGNAVAVTYTVNSYFGAKVIAGDTGFFLNDEMDDFTIKPGTANLFGLVQGAANAIQPGKRPLSSMSPTIVSKDGRPLLVLGSPGGSRIISAVVETMVNVLDHRMDLQAAVDAPRFHHQWLPDNIVVEPFAISRDTADRLAAMGYKTTEQQPWGAVEAILIAPPRPAGKAPAAGIDDSSATPGPVPGHLYGANDSRRPGGAALGY